MAYINNKELFAGTTSCMTALACMWASTMQKKGGKTKNQLRLELLDRQGLLDGPDTILAGNKPGQPKKSVKQNLNKPPANKKLLADQFVVYPSGSHVLGGPALKQKVAQIPQEHLCKKSLQQNNSPKQQEAQRPPNLNHGRLQSKIPVKVVSSQRQKNLSYINPHCASLQQKCKARNMCLDDCICKKPVKPVSELHQKCKPFNTCLDDYLSQKSVSSVNKLQQKCKAYNKCLDDCICKKPEKPISELRQKCKAFNKCLDDCISKKPANSETPLQQKCKAYNMCLEDCLNNSEHKRASLNARWPKEKVSPPPPCPSSTLFQPQIKLHTSPIRCPSQCLTQAHANLSAQKVNSTQQRHHYGIQLNQVFPPPQYCAHYSQTNKYPQVLCPRPSSRRSNYTHNAHEDKVMKSDEIWKAL